MAVFRVEKSRGCTVMSNHHLRNKELSLKAKGLLSQLVDIQAKLQAGKDAGYARWAKVFNLKQMAQTLNYLSEHGLLDYADLETKTAEATARYNELSDQIKTAEKRMAEIAVLRTHIVNYAKTRNTYIQRNSGRSMRRKSCCTRRPRKPSTS